MDKDYYRVLGIERGASQKDIDKAYRDLARKYHPDLNQDDAAAKQKFQEVQAAYDVLNDAKKRELYDRYGSDFEQMAEGPQWQTGGTGPFPDIDFSQIFGGSSSGGAADFFDQFMGEGGTQRGRRGRRRRRPIRGADLQQEIRIPFQRAVIGGKVSVPSPTAPGESIELTIQPGVSDGKKLRVRGQGQVAPPGGEAGDLYVIVRVDSHPFFSRDHEDLELRLPITFAEAVNGAKIDIPTPHGEISLTIPPGTSSGKRLRVKGQGIQRPGVRPGDLFVEVQIVVPNTLDDKSQELLDQLDKRTQLTPRDNLRW